MMRRRAWMIGLGASAVCAACGSESPPPTPIGPLGAWQSIDPAFAGCQGSCGAHADGPVDGVVVQPGALPGDRTYCPVSGAVFEVDRQLPRIEVEGGTLWFCCRACFVYSGEHREAVLRARGIVV